jgi:hypothetical protein
MNEYGELMEKSNKSKCKRGKKNTNTVGSTARKEAVGRFRHENAAGKQ